MPKRNLINRIWLLLSASGVLLVAQPVRADSETAVYAVIVANNRSLDPAVRPLRFADDDGAKYFEMFEAAGADTTLLAVLDPDAQRRFSSAAAAAIPPTRRALDAALARVFEKMAADRAAQRASRFVFVYSGHGHVGANREGYINLLDAEFRRSELFRTVIAPSPATHNHIILDACNAYYMVNKRGDDRTGDYTDPVRSFLAAEELNRYPNTGVILAASSESETHEWGKWESGIFSHELRSALLGAGDVNGDGIVTYDEAAACVEAANASVAVPKARLKVFYRPPASDVDAPLTELSQFSGARRLVLPASMAGRYHVEDSRGIRIADFNFSKEQPVQIVLPGAAPFFLRTEAQEASIDGANGEVLASNLTFRARASASRGSVEQSFRRDLYRTPFGGGFFGGVSAMRQTELPVVSPPPVESDGAGRAGRIAGWTLLAGGIGLGIGAGVTYWAAHSAYDSYETAVGEEAANAAKRSAESRLVASRVLTGVGATVAVVGTVLLVRDAVAKKKRINRVSAAAGPIEGGVLFGVSGKF